MSQYRQSPFSGEWTIIAGEREGRPHEFMRPTSRRASRECPFCVGHEHSTPSPVAVYGRVAPSLMTEQTLSLTDLRKTGSDSQRGGPGGAGRSMLRWQVRVVPNLFPAVGNGTNRMSGNGRGSHFAEENAASAANFPQKGTDAHPSQNGVDPEHDIDWLSQRTLPGLGVHEVIIESPIHIRSVTELSPDQAHLPLVAWRDRLRVLTENPSLEYAQIFRNAGPEAGASIEHLHSQLIAVPFLPPRIAEEDRRVKEAHAQTGRCLTCQVLEQELRAEERIIFRTPRFVVFTPHASRCPFETWIVPRHHVASIAEADESILRELADVSRRIVGRMEGLLVRPSYNMVLVNAPLRSKGSAAWHWRIELFPRLTHQAGFEWGTGCLINPVPPEDAAHQLRQWNTDAGKRDVSEEFAGYTERSALTH